MPLTDEQERISLTFYILLVVSGNVLVPILMICALVFRNSYSKSVLFMNFWISWVGYSIGFLLLFYKGQWRGEIDPQSDICRVQAVWVYISPVWTVATTVALILQLWFSVRSLSTALVGTAASMETRSPWRDRFRLRGLLLFPYFIFFMWAFAAILVAQARPEHVSFILLFCSIDFQPLRNSVAIFSVLGLGLAIILQIDIGRRLYINRLAIRQARVQGWPVVSLFTRMAVFVIVSGAGIVAAILAGSGNRWKNARQLIQAALPLASFICFGTNTGIYKWDKDSQISQDSRSQY